jgi:hypothetical protein
VEFFLQGEETDPPGLEASVVFANWASGAQLSGLDALYYADPDADGAATYSNISSVSIPSSPISGFSMDFGAGPASLVYRKNDEAAQAYLIEYSGNLGDWQVGHSSAGAGTNGSDDSITVQNHGSDGDGTPLLAAARAYDDSLFLRFNVPFQAPRREVEEN